MSTVFAGVAKSCFYRSIPLGKIKNTQNIEMDFTEKEKKFDPTKIYKGKPNPTKIQLWMKN